MGANKNPPHHKCGDIFLNLKTIKNKAKGFTFHCALCNKDCDQIKKFSKHIENHLEYFVKHLENATAPWDTDADSSIEAEEIKIEAESYEQLNDGDISNADSEYTPLKAYKNDPLETEKYYESEITASKRIKTEGFIIEEIGNDLDTCEEKAIEIVKEIKEMTAVYNELNNSLDCSADTDFDTEKELKSSKCDEKEKNINPRSLINTKRETQKTFPKKVSDSTKPKRTRRVIIGSILPFLVQQYKSYEILWQIDDLSYGIKAKRYEIYSKIAEILKEEKNVIITLDDLNYHINYLNDLYSKDKEKEMKSEFEGKEFIPEFELYKEMSFLSRSQGPFQCSICNDILPRYHPYCLHMAEHNDTQPYKCPSCDSSFISYYKYLVHKKRHLGIFDFHCDICGKGYMFKNDLEWHVTSHSGAKPFLCQVCGASFRARHHYNSHVRRHEERYRHECHICNKGFNYMDNLKIHIKSHLNIRDVICQICSKGFTHTKYLRRHELLHGEEKRYKCNECGMAFFQPCGLRAHRKNHHS